MIKGFLLLTKLLKFSIVKFLISFKSSLFIIMNRLEQIIREEVDIYLLEQKLIDENLGSWFKDKIKVIKDKALEFKKSGVREGYETVLAAKILLNIIKNKDASPDEVRFLKSQASDLAKVVTLLGLQPVPGNNIIIKLLDSVFKKFNIPFSFYPSSHTDDSNKKVLQKAYPEKELFEALLDETHTAQKDLEKLTTNILKKMGEYVLIQKSEGDTLTDKNFPSVMTSVLDNDGYKEIQDFLDDVNIPIRPVKQIGKSRTTRGNLAYASPSRNDGFEDFNISLKIPEGAIEQLRSELEKENLTSEDLYFSLYYPFYSTLLHELQHAYDAWRSKGKSFGGEDDKNYKQIMSKANAVRDKVKFDKSNATPEEIEAYNKGAIAYWNLVHEINARFSQAVSDIALTDIDFDSPDYDTIKGDWKRVFTEFKNTFVGWEYLSDKMKRKITIRLAKAYQEEFELRNK